MARCLLAALALALIVRRRLRLDKLLLKTRLLLCRRAWKRKLLRIMLLNTSKLVPLKNGRLRRKKLVIIRRVIRRMRICRSRNSKLVKLLRSISLIRKSFWLMMRLDGPLEHKLIYMELRENAELQLLREVAVGSLLLLRRHRNRTTLPPGIRDGMIVPKNLVAQVIIWFIRLAHILTRIELTLSWILTKRRRKLTYRLPQFFYSTRKVILRSLRFARVINLLLWLLKALRLMRIRPVWSLLTRRTTRSTRIP